jgi:hypothetical protein
MEGSSFPDALQHEQEPREPFPLSMQLGGLPQIHTFRPKFYEGMSPTSTEWLMLPTSPSSSEASLHTAFGQDLHMEEHVAAGSGEVVELDAEADTITQLNVPEQDPSGLAAVLTAEGNLLLGGQRSGMTQPVTAHTHCLHSHMISLTDSSSSSPGDASPADHPQLFGDSLSLEGSVPDDVPTAGEQPGGRDSSSADKEPRSQSSELGMGVLPSVHSLPHPGASSTISGSQPSDIASEVEHGVLASLTGGVQPTALSTTAQTVKLS